MMKFILSLSILFCSTFAYAGGGYIDGQWVSDVEILNIIGIGTTSIASWDAKLDSAGGNIYPGNLGINSASPTQKLDVVGTVKATRFEGDGSGLLGITAAGGWIDAGSYVYSVTAGDNIGIGTSAPVQKLEVVGTVKATAFLGDGSGLTGISGGGGITNLDGGAADTDYGGVDLSPLDGGDATSF